MWAQLSKPISLRSLLRRHRGWKKIIIRSEVEIWNGKTHILAKHNHFVERGLIQLVNLISNIGKGSAGNLFGVYSGYYTVKLGTNTATVTDASMTTLVAEIATEPNTLSGLNSNPATGTYKVAITATWNAGTVSGTIGELGLRWGGWAGGVKTFGWTLTIADSTKQLISRLSNADGDFTSFAINTGAPLTIEWRITLSFA